MKPRTPFLALAAALALPACIIHIDGHGGDWDGPYRFHVGDSDAGPRVRGNGVEAREARGVELEGVEGLVVQGGIDVRLSIGGPALVEVAGDENVLQHVLTEVDGDVLRISMERGSYELEQPLSVSLALPRLTVLRLEGSSDVDVRGLSGDRLALSILGSGDVALEGRLDALDLVIEGSGDVDARDVDVRAASVSVSGSGDASLGHVEELRAEVRGSGDVTYLGRPASRDVEVRGSGTVRSR